MQTRIISLEAALESLGLAHMADLFPSRVAGPDEYPTEADIFFLDEAFLADACEVAHLTPEMQAMLVALARRVAQDEPLRSYAWHAQRLLFKDPLPAPRVSEWPLLMRALDRDSGMFNVLILLSGTPRMREVHRARGIPPEVVRDTVLDLRRHAESGDYFQEFGQPGITSRILSWLLNHWRGDLYRLGRLQFLPGRFQGRLRAFRRTKDETVLALSEGGIRYRADGQIDGAGGQHDAAGGWVATFTMTGNAAIGCPILPEGHALKCTVRLLLDEWKLVLAPDEPVLAVHIPAGSPLDHELCGESFRAALSFFPRHFPDKPFAGFACESWILDSQFETLLGPQSNIVRFQREVYLYPILCGSGPALDAVFGPRRGDVNTLAQKTSMQRAFVRHLAAGGSFRAGGCFLLAADLAWGSQRYRRQNLNSIPGLTA